LLKLGEKRAMAMLAAGQKWEREQVARIKKLTSPKKKKTP